VDVVVLPIELDQLGIKVPADTSQYLPEQIQVLPVEHLAAVLSNKDQVDVKGRNYGPTTAVIVIGSYRPTCYPGSVLVRYRYRAYPTSDQEKMLARTFGCARVVYNDTIRYRSEVHGPNLGDAEIQTGVITLAKRTEQRAWLSDPWAGDDW